MARWEPDSRGRLRQAAFELYAERGYDDTTVAEIAEHAGLTERTFFRHFADKREVLFAGSEALQDAFVGAVVDAPESVSPIDAVVAGVEAAVAQLPGVEMSRQRQAIIDAGRSPTRARSTGPHCNAHRRDRNRGVQDRL
jgi:AcrR family transcriptional regulator